MALRREPDLRLLCERCGYHLKGFHRADVCPECGTAVVESLPGKRVLEPWHTRATFFSTVRFARRILRHPVRYWDTLPLTQDRPEMLIVDGSVLSGLVLGATAVGVGACLAAIGNDVGRGLIAISVVAPLPVIVVYITLSAIEIMGLRVIAWRHRWREGGYVASLVVANATIAWSIASVLTLLGAALGAMAGDTLAPVGGLAGFVLGLLAFETLVYIGMRRMKYANAPGSERELADAQEPPHQVPARRDHPLPRRGEGAES